tara:strand:- start:1491 stop:4904 length:3414 start_codon:yes stop_codon:yes gene_type:complete
MAKKVKIDVEIKGKGTKKVAVDAKKASKSLDDTSKSAHSADRNIKGVAAASSGASKNFSKMAQGMTGGIVPAYAVLAANIFAISAAFRFLKSAADVSNLQASQVQFAASTGQALGLMTDRLREASGGMLGLKEAGQATAIGMAQGFSGSQMEKLTEGAKKVSVALGRDFEDSFDRLVRGASKAEPELLDELGIVLRLKTATENYAAMIGKEVTALTAAERSQAVMVETMKQLDDKYSDVEGRENPFTQVKTVFDDIVRAVTEFVLPAFEMMARFISQNAVVAALAFGLLGLSIMKSILPFDSFSAKVDEWGENLDKRIQDATDELKVLKQAADDALQSGAKTRAEGEGELKGGAIDAVRSGGKSAVLDKAALGTMTKSDKKILDRQLKTAQKQIDKHGRVIRGTFKGVSNDIVKKMGGALKKTTKAHAPLLKSVKGLARYVGKQAVASYRKLGRVGIKAMKGIGRAAKKMGKITKLAMKGTVIIGVIQMIWDIMMKIIDAPFTIVKSIAKMLVKVIEVYQAAINIIKKAFAAVVNWVKSGIATLVNKISGIWEFLGGEKFTMEVTPMVVEETKFGEGLITWLEDLENQPWMVALKGFEEARQATRDWGEALDELEGTAKTLATTLAAMMGSVEEGKEAPGLLRMQEQLEKARTEGDPAEIALLEAAIGRFRTEAMASLGIGGILEDIMQKAGGDDERRAEALKVIEDKLGKEGASALMQISPALTRAIDELNVEEVKRLEALAGAFNANEKALTDGIDNMITQLESGDLYTSEAFVKGLANTRDSVLETSEALELSSQAAEKLNKAFESFGGLDDYLIELKSMRTEQIAIAREGQQIGIDKAAAKKLPAQMEAQRNLELTHLKEMNKLREIEFQIRQKTNMLQIAITKGEEGTQEKLRDELQQLITNASAQQFNIDLAEEAATQNYQIMETLGNSMEKNLISGFTALVQGTKSLKDAFKDMAISILKDITAIITKMMVMQALQNSGFSIFSSSAGAPNVTAGANKMPAGTTWGDIFSSMGAPTGGGGLMAKKGGIFNSPEYARGGISKSLNMLDSGGGYNVKLHGTEAVVPLPNGKSIPVDMKGGTNNIVVNVSGEGGSPQAQGDQEGLGKAIARAVQEELHNQKRSGGILNPYGVA